MTFSFQQWLEVSLWTAQLFYFACFVPQIFTNYKTKSGHGVSLFLLIGYLNAYLFLLFYVFCMDLPSAYKIMVPLQSVATLILIMQRLFYDPTTTTKQWLLYALNIGIFMFVIPYALKDPFFIGIPFGWMNFIFSVFNQLPQVFKIHREKSVIGFNFLFVLFTGVAALIETIAAIAAHLPIQTKFSAVRGVVLAVIFCWQFILYRNTHA